MIEGIVGKLIAVNVEWSSFDRDRIAFETVRDVVLASILKVIEDLCQVCLFLLFYLRNAPYQKIKNI